MESPDKIYLHKIRDEKSSGYHKMWFEQRARCVPSEEYIRKDKIREMVMYARNMSQTPDAAIRNWDLLIQEIDEL